MAILADGTGGNGSTEPSFGVALSNAAALAAASVAGLLHAAASTLTTAAMKWSPQLALRLVTLISPRTAPPCLPPGRSPRLGQ